MCPLDAARNQFWSSSGPKVCIVYIRDGITTIIVWQQGKECMQSLAYTVKRMYGLTPVPGRHGFYSSRHPSGTRSMCTVVGGRGGGPWNMYM